MKQYIAAILCAVALCGCGTTKPLDMNQVANKYYAQERAIKSLEMTNVSEFRVTGTNMNITIANELQPLSIMPRDPSVASELIQTAGRTIVAGVGIVTAGQVMNKLAERPTTVQPTVVRPEGVRVNGTGE